jgi:hypothetical protein
MKKRKIYLFGLLLAFGALPFISNAQQKIGGSVSAADPAAYLQLGDANGSTKGFLPSRVALTDRLLWTPMSGTPVAGMIVFNITSGGANSLDTGLVVWEGKWNPLSFQSSSAAASYWRLTGNATTTSTATLGTAVGNANFLGTTNAQNMIIGTNNTTRMIIDQSNNAYGGSGTTKVAPNAGNTFVWGQNNIDSSNYAVIGGLHNTIGTGSNSSAIFGSNHYISNSSRAFIAGDSNEISNSTGAVALGLQNTVNNSSNGNIVMGLTNTINNSNNGSVAMGQSNAVNSSNSGVAIGQTNAVNSNNGIAIGQTNAVNLSSSVAIGQTNTLNGSNSVAIGQGNIVNNSNSMALGTNVITTETNQLVLGFNSMVLPKAASAPAQPVLGQAYFDTTINKLRVWDGSTWQNAW